MGHMQDGSATRREPRRSTWRWFSGLTAIGLMVTAFISMAVPAGGSGSEPEGGSGSSQRREGGVGMCLRSVGPPLAETEAITAALEGEATARPHLFPHAAAIVRMPTPTDDSTLFGMWPAGTPSQLEAALADLESERVCARPARGWAFAVTRDMLADGADRVLEQADFGDDWNATIEVSFDAEDGRIRTALRFSGPLGISGSCWIDEWPSVDAATGLPMVRSERGDDAGLAGLVACRRFEAEMTEGGAGGQAMALFPDALASGDVPDTSLRATTVEVLPDLVVIRGTGR